jgi:hypothetical protein
MGLTGSEYGLRTEFVIAILNCVYCKSNVIAFELLDQRFSTGVPRHTGVTRRIRRCAAGVWGKVEKKREKFEDKKITLHHRVDHFIQNLIFHYFNEKKTETERE